MGSVGQVHVVDKKLILNLIHKQVESKTMEERYSITHKKKSKNGWLLEEMYKVTHIKENDQRQKLSATQ